MASRRTTMPVYGFLGKTGLTYAVLADQPRKSPTSRENAGQSGPDQFARPEAIPLPAETMVRVEPVASDQPGLNLLVETPLSVKLSDCSGIKFINSDEVKHKVFAKNSLQSLAFWVSIQSQKRIRCETARKAISTSGTRVAAGGRAASLSCDENIGSRLFRFLFASDGKS